MYLQSSIETYSKPSTALAVTHEPQFIATDNSKLYLVASATDHWEGVILLKSYHGLDAAIQTDRYLRSLFCAQPYNRFYDFHTPMYGDLCPTLCAGRGCPDSPDHNMHSCRIDLRKELQA